MFDRIRPLFKKTKRFNLYTDDLDVYRRIQMENGQPVASSALQPNARSSGSNKKIK